MRFIFLLLLALAAVPAALAANPVTLVPESAAQIRLSYAPLVKQAAPAVVNIYTKTVVRQRLVPPLLFQQFFGDLIPPEGISRERVQNSLGSGVIVRAEDGRTFIVTANHVIDRAEEIRVVLNDRREFPATVAIQDARADLAVLTIEVGDTLPALPLADSDTLDVGDLVMAIGNPFGVGQTVTTGIISAVARTGVAINDYNYFIQTDAAINPGNSGGALVTMDGRLAGVNTAIFSKDGGSLGIGFAIPANMVARTLEAGAGGAQRVVRPWLGIGGQMVTADLAASLGLPRPAGILVNTLHSASPAKAAGLRVGDVVTAFNGREVEDPEALKYRAAAGRIGERAKLSAMRKGQPLEVEFSLAAAPETPPADKNMVKDGILRGVTLANLSPAVADEYGLALDNESGVVVVESAGGFGFQPGDRLLAINGTVVEDVQDVLRVAGKLQRGGEFVLDRRGQTLRLAIGR